MGQTPSKKIGRTKSKELSHYDSFSKRSSHNAAAESAPPMAGNLVIPPLRPGEAGDHNTVGSATGGPGGSGLEVSTPGARKTVSGVAQPGTGVRGRSAGTAGGGGVSSGAAAAGAAVQGRSKSPPPAMGGGDMIASSPPDDGSGGMGLDVAGGGGPVGNGSISSTGSRGSTITPVGGGPQIPTTQTITAPNQTSSSSSSNPFRSSSPPPPSAMMSVSPQSSLSVPPGGGINNPSSSSLSTSPSPLALSQSGSGSTTGNTFNRTLDVDNMISRLLEAGYSGKVTKSPPLKNAEITAVCLAAREVFLSQPTLIELSPPVKIVGDVHGQVSAGKGVCDAM